MSYVLQRWKLKAIIYNQDSKQQSHSNDTNVEKVSFVLWLDSHYPRNRWSNTRHVTLVSCYEYENEALSIFKYFNHQAVDKRTFWHLPINLQYIRPHVISSQNHESCPPGRGIVHGLFFHDYWMLTSNSTTRSIKYTRLMSLNTEKMIC